MLIAGKVGVTTGQEYRFKYVFSAYRSNSSLGGRVKQWFHAALQSFSANATILIVAWVL